MATHADSVNHGSDWDIDDEVLAGTAGGAATGAVFAVFGTQDRVVAEVEKRIGVFVGAKNNRATFATVAAVWSALRDINLMAERNGAIAAFTSV